MYSLSCTFLCSITTIYLFSFSQLPCVVHRFTNSIHSYMMIKKGKNTFMFISPPSFETVITSIIFILPSRQDKLTILSLSNMALRVSLQRAGTAPICRAKNDKWQVGLGRVGAAFKPKPQTTDIPWPCTSCLCSQRDKAKDSDQYILFPFTPVKNIILSQNEKIWHVLWRPSLFRQPSTLKPSVSYSSLLVMSLRNKLYHLLILKCHEILLIKNGKGWHLVAHGYQPYSVK